MRILWYLITTDLGKFGRYTAVLNLLDTLMMHVVDHMEKPGDLPPDNDNYEYDADLLPDDAYDNY